MTITNTVGIHVPEILLPKAGVDMQKWAVVACDQYTSQPDYWEACDAFVGDRPSTLRLMLPELYLDRPDEALRIASINRHMRDYLDQGVLQSAGRGFMLIRREVDGKSRMGLVMALDLECYDFSENSGSLIRATEFTIVERIPPRLRIRKDAPLELPHIIVLIDDPQRTVLEPLAHLLDDNAARAAYDFDLMQGGGHIRGVQITSEAVISGIISAVEALSSRDAFVKKYGDKPTLLYAMGDGNHSFATAKANWEKLKPTLTEKERENHRARYALVELENLHDEGIIFEPIHRIVFNIDAKRAKAALCALFVQHNGACELLRFDSLSEQERAVNDLKAGAAHVLPFVDEHGYGCFAVRGPSSQLEVGTLQNELDRLLQMEEFKGAAIDYVHGADVVYKLGGKPDNLGFILPAMEKSDLFPTVVFDGALPRKTFSMGEANEKRFYLECRKIR